MMENAAFVTEPASETITPEKLRELITLAYDPWIGNAEYIVELRSACRLAADRIEELENNLRITEGSEKYALYQFEVSLQIETELRATNAKLLAALEWLCVDAKITGLDQQAGWDCAFIAARAAIAAANGGDE